MNDLLNRAAGVLLAALIPATELAQPATAKDPAVSSIGGRWRILEGDQPKYFYQDGDRLVDLFAYHALDSNQDGVPNVRISHDANHLILRSQGYPNHPTAVFSQYGQSEFDPSPGLHVSLTVAAQESRPDCTFAHGSDRYGAEWRRVLQPI